jgi:tetratricopeptide (TPR) repeat protein
MNKIFRTGLVGVSLFLVTISCVSQVAGDKQKELAAHIKKSADYLRDKRPDLAIPELQAAVAIDPENVEAQGNVGVLLFFQGRLAEAIPHLRAALKMHAGMTRIEGLLGIAEQHTSDFASARKDLESAFPLIGDRRFKIEVGLDLVGIYTQVNDRDAAAEVILQLRKAYPDDAEVLYAAYRTYSDLAGESMLMLSLVAPDSAQMHQLMAHEESKQGNTNGAIAHYRKAIQINPRLPGVHFELAELLHTSLDANIKKEAEQEYRVALAANPEDVKTECRLAEIDTQKGDIAQAFTEYSRAAELEPADTDAKLGLAKTLIEMNQPDKALTLLEQTVQLEPTNALAHYRLGTLYRKLGRLEEAQREVELYKKYREMKDKLRAIYKELQIQPNEIRNDEPDEK